MKILTITSFFLLALFTSCTKIVGEGPIISETRNITGFTGIDLRSSANIYFKEDSVFKVELQAQQNILNVMETYVTANHLVTAYKNDVRVKSAQPITIIISAPEINSLRISGSGNINSTEILSATDLNLDISGSGNILLTGAGINKLIANTSGSGDTRINSGNINEEKLTISGSGNIHLGNIPATKASTTTSGSGNIYINVIQQLNSTISGSGSVFYHGNPAVNVTNSGSGKVMKM